MSWHRVHNQTQKYAKNRGVFILAEKGARGVPRWRLYCRTTGRLIMEYYPDSRRWCRLGQQGEVGTVWAAIDLARKLKRAEGQNGDPQPKDTDASLEKQPGQQLHVDGSSEAKASSPVLTPSSEKNHGHYKTGGARRHVENG